MKRIKQNYKVSKKGNKKKKIMPSGPKGRDRPAFWRKSEIQKKEESSKGGK